MARGRGFAVLGGLLLLGLAFGGSKPPKAAPRAPLKGPEGSAAKEATDPVARAALAELARWKGIDDEDPAGRRKVAQYWQEIDRDPDLTLPWSGAFIAATVNRALPGALPKIGGHAAYARTQLYNPAPGEAYSTFLGSLPVKPGDIILKPRPGEHREFDELRGDFFPSHADIVVRVTDGEALAVGGNKIGGRVASEIYPLNPDGSAQGVFAVLRRGSDFPTVIANVPGYRRAAQAEVRPEWQEDIGTALRKYTLGEVLSGPGYALAVETHSDERRGPHRGVSVFVPEGVFS